MMAAWLLGRLPVAAQAAAAASGKRRAMPIQHLTG